MLDLTDSLQSCSRDPLRDRAGDRAWRDARGAHAVHRVFSYGTDHPTPHRACAEPGRGGGVGAGTARGFAGAAPGAVPGRSRRLRRRARRSPRRSRAPYGAWERDAAGVCGAASHRARRAAVRQRQRRPRKRVLQRRHDRRAHHRARPSRRTACRVARIGVHVQGEGR
jgi:hypothetical protein